MPATLAHLLSANPTAANPDPHVTSATLIAAVIVLGTLTVLLCLKHLMLGLFVIVAGGAAGGVLAVGFLAHGLASGVGAEMSAALAGAP